MGKAIIVENRREGLYRIKLLYNNKRLDDELQNAKQKLEEFAERITQARLTIRSAKRDAEAAVLAMNAVVEQYTTGLLNDLQPPPQIAPPTGTDPETGQPWTNPDRAQDAPLLNAINAARANAGKLPVNRSSDLDKAILKHLQDCAFTSRISHFGPMGTTPENRVSRSGYAFDAAIGVGELLAAGQSSPTAAVADWLKSRDDTAVLTADAPDVGVAFVYSGRSPYGYHWGAILAAPGTALSHEVNTDPAKAAKDAVEDQLRQIKTPDPQQLPQQLAVTCGEAAKAARKYRAAEDALAKILLERTELSVRITELEQAKKAGDPVIDAWCCVYYDLLMPGITVDTAEVPGFWDAQTVSNRVTRMGIRNDRNNTIPDEDVTYTERHLNIVPPWVKEVGITDCGQLEHTEALSDAGVVVNLALEPAHLRYKPLWRYGTITSRGTGDLAATVTLDPIPARRLTGERALPLDSVDQEVIHNVPIFYPECHGAAFAEGDAVLIAYAEHDRNQPKIIGFRREPKPCPKWRVWIQRA